MTATLTHPHSVGAIAERLSDHERRCLRRAFEHLGAGDAAGFHYALWVGFGDTWRSFRQSLIHGGFVQARRREHEMAPTARTSELLRAFDDLAA